MEFLRGRLVNAPYICESIGYDAIIKSASPQPSYIAEYFGNPDCNLYQSYLEGIFRTLNENGIKYSKRKFREVLNPETGNDILTEFEVAAKLAPEFNVRPDYPINKAVKKSRNLDLEIEDKLSGEKCLMEIATKHDNLGYYKKNEATIDIPGRRMKKKCLYKIEGQLKDIRDKKIDLNMPLLLLFKFDGIYSPNGILHALEVLAGLYGALQISIWTDKTGNVVKEALTRADEGPYTGIYHNNDVDFITKIGTYQLGYEGQYIIDGKFHDSIVPPRYKMSPEFEQKLNKALFDKTS